MRMHRRHCLCRPLLPYYIVSIIINASSSRTHLFSPLSTVFLDRRGKGWARAALDRLGGRPTLHFFFMSELIPGTEFGVYNKYHISLPGRLVFDIATIRVSDISVY